MAASELVLSHASIATAAESSRRFPGVSPDLIASEPGIANPTVLRAILLDAQVSRMLAGAGDGDLDPAAVAEESRKFQDMIDQGRSFSVPEPRLTYAVNTLRLSNGQTIEGSGQYSSSLNKFQFTGNGRAPVFQLGDGTGAIRQQTLRDLSVFNKRAPCIEMNNAPNVIIDRVRARTEVAGNTLNGVLSYRAAIRDSNITCSGGGTAINLLNNMNGLSIENVTCTGGIAGRAIRVGMSQGVRIVSNIVESSLDGIWISSTPHKGDGNCNGVLVAANYFEQCKTPLKLGTSFSLFGLECVSNFISNSNTEQVPPREACIQFGRIRGGLIADNSLLPHQDEDLFWIWLEHASGSIENLTIERNYSGAADKIRAYSLKGPYADNASVKGAVGAQCNFDFVGGMDRLGSSEPREWISDTIEGASAPGPISWLSRDRIGLGGKVISAEIIDYDGGSLSEMKLKIGRAGSPAETVDVDQVSALVFTHGRAQLPLGRANIFVGEDCIYEVVSRGRATATFRIRLRYRAN